MKKKRILLHVMILVLTVVCFGTGMYGAKHYWSVQPKTYYAHQFQENYKVIMREVIASAGKQYLYRRDFADDNKILVKGEKENITAKDIKVIYRDENRKETYYNKIENYSWSDYDSLSKKQKRRYEYWAKLAKYMTEYGIVYDDSSVKSIMAGNDEKSIKGKSQGNTQYSITYKVGGTQYRYVSDFDYDKSDKLIDQCILEYGEIKALDDKGIMKSLKVNLRDFSSDMEEQYSTDYASDWDSEWSDFSQDIEEILNNIEVCNFGISKNMTYDDYTHQLIEKYNDAPENLFENERYKLMVICICIATIIAALAMFIILMAWAGYRKKSGSAGLHKIDKLWIDLWLILILAAGAYGIPKMLDILASYWNTSNQLVVNIVMIALGIILVILVEMVVLICESFVRRLKYKSLIKTTLLGKICSSIKKAVSYILLNTKTSILTIVFGVVSLVWMLVALKMAANHKLIIGVIMTIVLVIAVVTIIVKFVCEYNKIADGTKKIADGNLDYKLEEEYFFKMNKKLKDGINNIGDGLSKAVGESLKNERMKTELITNVSHDLKTPLTSIINYVGLLKNEGVESENAEKYLDVIDKKSMRLKNLTEDLVEASKLNSDVITFNKEKIDIVQLINQSIGEYEEKFDEKQLTIIKNIQEEPVYVMADGRRTWRVFENLYGNIYKYAMESTRVYVDVKCTEEKVYIAVKNISDTPLDFDADELMERFVRGDKSRTTEGNGLGLSIAKSIVEKQDGEMKISTDGDLFKVEIVMNKK